MILADLSISIGAAWIPGVACAVLSSVAAALIVRAITKSDRRAEAKERADSEERKKCAEKLDSIAAGQIEHDRRDDRRFAKMNTSLALLAQRLDMELPSHEPDSVPPRPNGAG